MHRTSVRIARSVPLLGTAALLLAGCNVVPDVELTAIAQQMEIDGTLDVQSSEAALGSGPNTVEQLGLDDDPTLFVPRATFSWLWFDLFVDYFDASYSGSGTANLNFSGTPISGPVDSELDWAQARALATFDLVPSDMFDLGIGLGVSYIDFHSKFTSGGNTEEIEGSAPLPYPVARASVEFWRIEVGGTAGWIEFNADDVDARYVEADLYARLKLIGGGKIWGGLVVGYRMLDTDIDFEDDGDFGRIDMELGGPYAGLTVAL